MSNQLKFIDLFCGVGGFHQAFLKMNKDENKKTTTRANQGQNYTPNQYVCVLASDNNKACQETYRENYMTNKFIKEHNQEFNYEFNEDICELSNSITKLVKILILIMDQFQNLILYAGFPCQPFSNQRKYLKILDTLFHDIMTLSNI